MPPSSEVLSEFVEAAKNGDLVALQSLLRYEEQRLEPLREASNADNSPTPTVGSLLNGSNEEGNTALMAACEHSRTEVAMFLADHPLINLNVRDSVGCTALHCATSQPHSLSIVSYLLSKDQLQVNANLYDSNATSLHYASRKGYLEIVKVLLSHSDIIVNFANSSGVTALMLAISKENESVALELIDHPDTDLNVPDNSGSRALHYAARRNSVRLLPALLQTRSFTDGSKKHGANLYVRDEYGDTPLHDACAKGHQQVVKILLRHDPLFNVNLRNDAGNTLIDVATKKSIKDALGIVEVTQRLQRVVQALSVRASSVPMSQDQLDELRWYEICLLVRSMQVVSDWLTQKAYERLG